MNHQTAEKLYETYLEFAKRRHTCSPTEKKAIDETLTKIAQKLLPYLNSTPIQ